MTLTAVAAVEEVGDVPGTRSDDARARTPGEPFGGRVGRTVAESTPWWPAPRTPPAGSPDVVLVVFDDIGFGDFGCFGSEIATPTLDGLASRGLRFNNFHTTALCSPTRACLLTGRNHHSVGMGVVSNWDTGFPGYRGRVSDRAGTMAEVLRDAGYATMAVGKWHLACMDETSAAGPYDQWPLGRGFNRFYGFLDGATDQWTPELVCDNHRIDPPRRPGYHLTEDLVDQAIGMIRDQVSVLPEQPLFLYLCFGTAHSPLHAPADVIARYRGRYDAGWDAVREARLARQVELGVVPAGSSLAPRNAGVRPWADLSVDERRSAARFQEVYAAMIEHTDRELGRLVDELKAMGRFDNTLLFALSDNGATLEGGPDGSVNYMRWATGAGTEPLAERIALLDEIGGPDTYPVYPMGWGQASNTPLKRYKQNTHAGGVRDPLIVSWPTRITDNGAVVEAFCHAIDVMPTVLDVAAVDRPAQIAGLSQMPVEGVSFAHTLADPAAATRKQTQYFEMLGNRGIWADGWKAVAYHAPGSSFDDDRWELYHLDRDFSEGRDLAAQEPQRLAELQEMWWAEAERHQVLPLDDRILERFLVDKPRPIRARRRFVYYPGARIPGAGAVTPFRSSFTITAELEAAGPASDGVLIAGGTRFGGYALFLLDGHLCYDSNSVGEHTVVRSDDRVPPGARRLGCTYDAGTREVTLLVDGAPGGHGQLPRVTGVQAAVSVGRDVLGPVSTLYETPFAFTGGLRRVVVELDADAHPHVPGQLVD